MAVSYSERPLKDKLGIKDGIDLLVINKPSNYELLISSNNKIVEELEEELETELRFEFIHYFVIDYYEILKDFSKLKRHLSYTGTLWISWVKGSFGIKSEMNENIIRTLGLKEGLVDIKIVAVDDKWSGLKFVWRTADRN